MKKRIKKCENFIFNEKPMLRHENIILAPIGRSTWLYTIEEDPLKSSHTHWIQFRCTNNNSISRVLSTIHRILSAFHFHFFRIISFYFGFSVFHCPFSLFRTKFQNDLRYFSFYFLWHNSWHRNERAQKKKEIWMLSNDFGQIFFDFFLAFCHIFSYFPLQTWCYVFVASTKFHFCHLMDNVFATNWHENGLVTIEK